VGLGNRNVELSISENVWQGNAIDRVKGTRRRMARQYGFGSYGIFTAGMKPQSRMRELEMGDIGGNL
jgi:hypothetical protein